MAASENQAAARPGAPRSRKASGRHRAPSRTVGEVVAGPAATGTKLAAIGALGTMTALIMPTVAGAQASPAPATPAPGGPFQPPAPPPPLPVPPLSGPTGRPALDPSPALFASEVQALNQLKSEAQQAPASPSVQAYLHDLDLQIAALTDLESDYQMLSLGAGVVWTPPPGWSWQAHEAAYQQVLQLQQATQQAEQDAQATPVAQADASVQPGIAAEAAVLQDIATVIAE